MRVGQSGASGRHVTSHVTMVTSFDEGLAILLTMGVNLNVMETQKIMKDVILLLAQVNND